MLQLGNKITVGEPIYKFQNNHSVDFDGADDFIQLGQPISYTQHTISTWIKAGNNDANSTIIDARDADDDGIRLRATTDEKIIYSLNTSDLTSTNSFVDEWVHIVATYDGTTQKLYINGSLDKSATTSQTVSVTTNAKIGARNFSSRANEFLGKIDELAIWDRALTQAEVTEIYRIKYGANLVQNGRFDELGSEIMTDGNFSEGLTHYTTNNVQVSNGVVSFDSNSDWMFQNHGSSFTTGKTYKVSTEGTGNLRFRYGFTNTAGTLQAFSVGTNIYFVADSDTNRIQFFGSASSTDATLSNISVKQVDPNDRFTLDAGWSYGDGVAICDGTNNADILQSGSVAGKTYRVNFTITENNGGRLSVFIGGQFIDHTGNGNSGNFTFIGEAIDSTLIRFRSASFNGSITNVMVEEQKYVASNLKLNSGNYKSADPVIVSTKSVDFDGSDAYLEVQDATALQLAGSQATWSFWTKLDTLSGGDMKFLAKAISAGSDLAGYQIRTNNADLLYQFNNGTWRTVTASNFFLDLNFTHVAITHDGSNNVKIYRNGVLVEDSSIGYVIPANTGELLFGARTPDSPTNFLNGKLDEVGIFNTALTSDQVGELYNQGVPSNLATSSAGTDGALIGYWKMGDGTLDEAPLIADQTNATLGSELVTGETGKDINTSGVYTDVNTNANTTTGDILQVTFTVTNSSGVITLFNYFGTSVVGSSTFTDGTHTQYLQIISSSSQTDLRFYSVSGRTGTLSNISIKKVNGNPAIMQNTPTIVTDAPLTKIRNYYRMGDGILDKFPLICDMIEPSLGNNLVLNGTFETAVTTDEWTNFNTPTTSERSTTYAYEGNFSYHIVSDAGNEGIFATASQFNGDYAVGDIVKVQAFVYPITASSNQLKSGLNNSDRAFNTTVTGLTLNQWNQIEYYVTIVTATNNYLTFLSEGAGDEFYLDNVSTQVVNGVAGIMTNMSEADITNDVPS